jgi:hypothetical protein
VRPRGEIRQALADAAQQLAAQREGFTWREAAEAACVGFAHAKQGIKDMARAGELQALPHTRQVPGVCRPMRLYAPTRRESWVGQGAELAQVFTGWRRA